MAAIFGPACALPTCSQFFLPTAIGRAKLRSAKVIALASESKFGLVRSLGADHVFDNGKPGWSAKMLDVTRPQGIQVFLDSDGDLATAAFQLLSQFGRWIVYGARSVRQNGLPASALWAMIEKSISLTGFNLGGNFGEVPRVLRELFTLATDKSIKVEITKYPLAEASVAHSLLEGRKSTGKLVLIP